MYVIILRLLHIVGGVIWAGAGLFQVFVLQPAAREQGASGGAFMKSLMSSPRMGRLIGGSAVVTLASGVLLYWGARSYQCPDVGPSAVWPQSSSG